MSFVKKKPTKNILYNKNSKYSRTTKKMLNVQCTFNHFIHLKLISKNSLAYFIKSFFCFYQNCLQDIRTNLRQRIAPITLFFFKLWVSRLEYVVSIPGCGKKRLDGSILRMWPGNSRDPSLFKGSMCRA